jgi:Undecaprenyl-phosphate glucose phosphotransferase
LVSYWLRFKFPVIKVTKGFPGFETYAALTPLVVILWGAILHASRAYRGRRMLRRTDEVWLLVRAHCTALVIFISLTYLITEYRYSRGVMIYFGVLGAVVLVSVRLLLRNLLRWVRKQGYNLRHILVVGEGAGVETLIRRIQRFPELGFRVQGVLVGPASLQKSIAGVPVLGDYSHLLEILGKGEIDQVVVAPPRGHSEDLEKILNLLKDQTIEIHLIPDLHEYIALGCEVEDFDGLPIVHLNDSPMAGWGLILKRLTDFALTLLALIFLSPLLALIAFLVKWTSPGPVLYRQERMGLDGKTFEMLKFRSMRVDAENETGAVWATQGDQRKTRFGSFLRATSLDELPQLWNVLKGEMSLVGPRPERPVFVSQFRSQIPHYMLRHKVKAGLTGWAQVNGWRGNTSLERRIECDLFYIRNWSYFFDWKIIFMTFWKGFIHKNAY